MKAIPVLIARILPPSMADGAVLIAPLAQARIDVVLVSVDLRARSYRGPNQRLNRRLLDVL
jgi:hypothetical protein